MESRHLRHLPDFSLARLSHIHPLEGLFLFSAAIGFVGSGVLLESLKSSHQAASTRPALEAQPHQISHSLDEARHLPSVTSRAGITP